MEAEKLKNSHKVSSTSDSEESLAYSSKEEETEAKVETEVLDDEDDGENNTQAELTKIPLMRAFVEAKDPSAKVSFFSFFLTLPFDPFKYLVSGLIEV